MQDVEPEDVDEESVFSTITSNIGYVATLGKNLRKGLEGE